MISSYRHARHILGGPTHILRADLDPSHEQTGRDQGESEGAMFTSQYSLIVILSDGTM